VVPLFQQREAIYGGAALVRQKGGASLRGGGGFVRREALQAIRERVIFNTGKVLTFSWVEVQERQEGKLIEGGDCFS